MPHNADFIRKRQIKLIWSNTQLTRSVARGPRASQCRLYPKTSNQTNVVQYPIDPICSARSPCLAKPTFIRRRQIKLIWSNTQLTRSVARGPRASQCRLYPKTSNQTNLVQYPIDPICSARSPCLAMPTLSEDVKSN